MSNWSLSSLLPGVLAIAVSCDEPSPGTPLGGDLELVLVTDTVFVAGGPSATEIHAISRVASLGFDGRGNLHVFDRDQYRVTTWNDEGVLVREVGRRGEGPGEFRVPRYTYTLRDGRVLVLDIGPPALWVFGPRGRYERSMRLSPGDGRPVPGARSVYAGNRLVGVDDYWMSRSLPKGQIPLFTFSFTNDSVEAAPYHTAWTPLSDQDDPLSDQNDLAMLPTVRIAGFSDGRIAVADSVDYRIKVLSEDGEVVNVIERPIAPLPLADVAMKAERERRKAETSTKEVTQAVSEMAAVLGVSLPALGDEQAEQVVADYIEALKDLQFADEIPVIREIGVDWDNRILTCSSPTRFP